VLVSCQVHALAVLSRRDSAHAPTQKEDGWEPKKVVSVAKAETHLIVLGTPHDSTLSQSAVYPPHPLNIHVSFRTRSAAIYTEYLWASWFKLKSTLFWDVTKRWLGVCHRHFGIICRSVLQESLLEPWRIDRYGVLKRGYLNTSQLWIISTKNEDTVYTPEEACNYARLKQSCFLLVFGGVPFEYLAERRQFWLRVTVGLFSTSRQITQNPLDIIFLSVHYNPILKHVTKLSINENDVRTSTFFFFVCKAISTRNQHFKPYIKLTNTHICTWPGRIKFIATELR
jgi:hypothetical protein